VLLPEELDTVRALQILDWERGKFNREFLGEGLGEEGMQEVVELPLSA
jgi:hypothetical protein